MDETSSRPATLILNALGQLEILSEGRPAVGLALRKTQALLVYLAVNPGLQPRSRLAGLLWGDQPEAAARRNLRHALSELRRRLGDALLQSDRLSVALNPDLPCQVDVLIFEEMLDLAARRRQAGEAGAAIRHLETAVALYRGAFLERFDLPDCPEFDGWVVRRRARLHGRALEALAYLADYYARRGEHERALRHARQQLTLEPWWEAAHCQVMYLLALTGQRDAALRQYEDCRRLLRSEVGMEPLEETTALYQRLLSGDRAGKGEGSPPERAAAPCTPADLPFIGRGEEHARLVEWWERVQRGAGRLALIEGEAGAGKTRLVEEALGYARAHGTQVAHGRCYEFGEGLPYQPITEALREYLRLSPARSASLSPVWLAELSRLLPELRVARPDLPEPPRVTGEAARQRLFEATARFLTWSPAPCILFLDDLHWADPFTLDLLHYLVRRTCDTPFGIIGTYRSEEAILGCSLTRLRQGLSRDRLVEHLILLPLPVGAVAEIACAIVGPEQGAVLGAFLHRESEGNPLILVETVYALQEQGALQPGDQDGRWQWRHPPPGALLPLSVQDVILQRVERLSEPAQQLLALAAVVGRQFDLPLLRAADGSEERVVDQSLDEWLARRLVRSAALDESVHQSFDFSHDKIRAVVYQAAGPQRRRQLHRRVAMALEQLAPQRMEELAGLLAYHWEKAGEPAQATDALLKAGDQARLVYAHQAAVDHYLRALTFLEQQGEHQRAARALMKLGLTYHNAFDFRQARQAYDESFALWRQADWTPPADAAPTASHTLRVRWEEPTSLDPTLSPDTHTSELIAQLFSGLVALSPEMDIVPDGAHSWRVSEDGHRLTFHLSEDARWSDGVAVTAEDYVYAWKRVLARPPGDPTVAPLCEITGVEAYRNGRGRWEDVGIRALGALTLEIELEVPTGYFFHLLAHTPFYPVPRHVVEEHGDAWADAANLVTNGPFVLAQWEKGKRLVLVRHAGYHGRSSGNVLRVELYALADSATRMRQYDADALDVLGITYFATPDRESVRQRHADEYLSTPRLCVCYIVFDGSRPPFDDLRVRQALALATDRDALADEVLEGCASPATGGLLPPGMPGHVPDAGLPYDPERARCLLAEAGYPDGGGFPALRALAFRAVETRCRYLHAQWRKHLGIGVAWQVMEWVPFLDALRQTEPSMFIAMWTADYPDPDNLLRLCRSDHWAGWRDTTYDALVAQARHTLDQDRRMELYAQAQRILAEAVPILPLTYEREHLLIKPWVRRYPISGNRTIFWKDVEIEAMPGEHS